MKRVNVATDMKRRFTYGSSLCTEATGPSVHKAVMFELMKGTYGVRGTLRKPSTTNEVIWGHGKV